MRVTRVCFQRRGSGVRESECGRDANVGEEAASRSRRRGRQAASSSSSSRSGRRMTAGRADRGARESTKRGPELAFGHNGGGDELAVRRSPPRVTSHVPGDRRSRGRRVRASGRRACGMRPPRRFRRFRKRRGRPGRRGAPRCVEPSRVESSRTALRRADSRKGDLARFRDPLAATEITRGRAIVRAVGTRRRATRIGAEIARPCHREACDTHVLTVRQGWPQHRVATWCFRLGGCRGSLALGQKRGSLIASPSPCHTCSSGARCRGVSPSSSRCRPFRSYLHAPTPPAHDRRPTTEHVSPLSRVTAG